MSSRDSETPAKDASLIYAAFLQRLQRGERLLIADLIALHPEFAEELKALHGQQATLEMQPTVGGEAAPSGPERQVITLSEASRTYAVRSRLAQGGMGVILRVWDEKLHREVAMKLIRGQAPLAPGEGLHEVSPQKVARFVREAKITAKLDHPGVVPIHELDRDEEGRVFFTMRLIEGQSLAAVFREVRAGSARWTQTRVLDVVLKVCETVAYAHSRDVIHRDLKPANIMTGPFGETYVMDWGLAKMVRARSESETSRADGQPISIEIEPVALPEGWGDGETSSEPTIDGSVLGTPSYMPPEQASGRIDELDERSDIYSVGMILYELLARRHPYSIPGVNQSSQELVAAVRAGPPESLPRLNPRAHAELVAICEKATARRSQDRYQSMLEMGEDLRAYLERRVVRAYQTGAAAELKKWIARNRGAAIASLTAALTFIGGLLAVVLVQSAANRSLYDANQTIRQETSRKQAALVKETQAKRREIAARRAEEFARRRAEGLFLAHESADAAASNPGQALLLALESHARHAGFEANSALLAALAGLHETHTLLGHRGAIRALAISSDGARAVTASADHTAIVWNLEAGEPTAWLVGHGGSVGGAQFSPDDRLILTASGDNTAALWSAATGERLKTFVGHQALIHHAVFSPDGGRVATASQDGAARVWDVETGNELIAFRGHRGPVTTVNFDPQGKSVVSASDDQTVRIWDASTGESRATLKHAGRIRRALISPDGRQILTCEWPPAPGEASGETQYAAAQLWDALSGERKLALKHIAAVACLAFSPAGDRILTGAVDGSVRIWDAAKGRLDHELKVDEGHVSHVAFAPGGRRVAAATRQGPAYFWDLAAPAEPVPLRGHTDVVSGMAFRSPDELVTGSRDGALRVWRLRAPGRIGPSPPGGYANAHVQINRGGSRVIVHPLPGSTVVLASFPEGDRIASLEHDARVLVSKFNSAEDLVATLDQQGVVRVWSAVEGRLCLTIAGAGQASQLQFGADDRLCVLSRGEHLATIWNARTGELLDRVEFTDAEQETISADGRFLLACRPTLQEADIVELGAFKRTAKLTSLTASAADFVTLEISPDSRRVVAWTVEPPRARLWELQTGKPVVSPLSDGQRISTVVFSPEGRVFVTGSNESIARIWTSEAGEPGPALSGHESSAGLVFVGPDGERVVTCSSENRARLWNGRTGQSIALLSDRDDPLNRACFSSDGKRLFTLHANGERFVLWDAVEGRRMSRIAKLGEGFSDVALSPDGEWYVTADRNGSAQVWPFRAAEFAAQHAPRRLTPDERELLQIGDDGERARYRQAWRQRRAVQFLELASKTPLKAGNQTHVFETAVEQMLDEFVDSLESDSARADIASELQRLAKELRRRGGLGSLVGAALARCFLERGEFVAAERLFAAALARDGADDASLWADWAACCLGGLKRPPAELLAKLPSERSAAVEDVRWLLERLAASQRIRIRAGGDDFTAGDGSVWRRDCFFGGGFRFGETLGRPQTSSEPIAKTDDDLLYQTERWFDRASAKQERGYHVPVPPGRYRVTLHFAEIFYRPPGSRIMDVLAEDVVKISAYNSLAAGFATADQRSFELRVDDGWLDLEFRGRDKDPKISALEIERLGD